MKKKVRVYKPGGEANQPTQEQVINYIAQRMSSDDFDGDTEALKEELAQAGISEDYADQYIEYVNENLGLSESEDTNEEDAFASEEEQARMEEEQALFEEQQAAEQQARREQLNAMYDTDIDMSTTEDTPEDEETYMQYGGAKPSKRSFVNNYTKLVKKQMGGDTPTPGADDVLNGREAHVKGFLGAVTRTAQDARLKEEAENQYNSIYGAPQVGAFQDGGIQQEQIDTESPYDHLAKDTAARRHIFSDNMYTQNDVAAMEQYGGNTGQGLYKFIGGGDNEYIDEEYQDADLDYPQYARHGGALHKYQKEGETTEDWKAKYDVLSKDLEAQKAKQDMIEKYMMQQYTGQQQPTRVRNPIISRGQRYNQAVGNPYYTATGEKIPGLDFNKLKATSIHVDKSNIFGRPKEFTINYGDSSGLSSGTPEIKMPEEKSNRFSNRFTNKANSNQPIASWMMNSNIPGIRGIGSHFYDTIGYEGVQPTTTTPIPADQQNKYLQITGVSDFSKPNTEQTSANQPVVNNQTQLDIAKKIENTIESGQNSGLSNDEQAYQDFLIRHQGPQYKAYGGPIDYTEYAYGGDISIPELYTAQVGVQTFDPNDNAISRYKVKGLNTTDYKGDTYDSTGKLIKKRDTDFSFGKDATNLDNPFDIDKNYTNPLTGEKPGVRMGSDGKYTNEGLLDDSDKNQPGVSQKFKNKSEWIVDLPALGDATIAAGNMFENLTDSIRANRQQNQLLENTTAAETNYGINNQRDKGTYDPNSGLFRPDQMGFNGVVKYGGGVYADGGNTMDEDEDVQYMTQEEIDDFLANGGELEYL